MLFEKNTMLPGARRGQYLTRTLDVFVFVVDTVGGGGHDHPRQLGQTGFRDQIPGVPQGVLASRGQPGPRHRGAIHTAHDTVGQ